MTTPDCEAIHDLLPEVALDVADARDRAQVLAHTEECAACRRALAAAVTSAEELAALAPPVEPPAGFDLRVMDALARAQAGPAAPGDPTTPATIAPATMTDGPAVPGPSRTTPDPATPSRPGPGPTGTAPSHAGPSRTGSGRPSTSHTGPGRTRTGPARSNPDSSHTAPRPRLSPHHRPLMAAAAALALLIGVSGVVGWAVGRSGGGGPHAPAGVTAAPLQAGPQVLGRVLLAAGPHPWLAMAVSAGDGAWPASGATANQGPTTNTTVRCQVQTATGAMVDVGTFSLPAGGYGYWSAPVPAGTVVVGARLVDSLGGVIAAATFPPTKV